MLKLLNIFIVLLFLLNSCNQDSNLSLAEKLKKSSQEFSKLYKEKKYDYEILYKAWVQNCTENDLIILNKYFDCALLELKNNNSKDCNGFAIKDYERILKEKVSKKCRKSN